MRLDRPLLQGAPVTSMSPGSSVPQLVQRYDQGGEVPSAAFRVFEPTLKIATTATICEAKASAS